MRIRDETKDVMIDADLIPDAEIYIGCSIIASSIRSLFRNPDIKAEYEAWLKSPEGQKAREWR